MTYHSVEPTPTKSSRLALAVVLSTMSVAAIAGPLAYQAIEARDVKVGPATDATDLAPDVGGVTTQRTTAALVETVPELESESTAMSTEGPDEDPSSVESSAPTGTRTPATDAPSPAPDPPDTQPPPTVSSDPPSAERSTSETAEVTPESSLQIPSSPGTSPTWIPTLLDPTNGEVTNTAPSTTSPNPAPDRSEVPPSTDGSTSGSVTTVGPSLPTTVVDPLDPVDPPGSSTSTTVPSTTTVVTEPLDPVDPDPTTSTTVPATSTTDTSSSTVADSTGPDGTTSTTQGSTTTDGTEEPAP